MEKLVIEATSFSPEIKLIKEDNTFILQGRSIMENPYDFFQPVIKWLENYDNEPNADTNFEFKMEYSNTSSSKQLSKVFLLIEKIAQKSNVVIKWYYDNDSIDIYNLGCMYARSFSIKFDFVLVP